MSRIAKWKLDKTKVKVVFRLQFHATHIPQSGWDKLFISFIPADSGKATAKTTKANVRNGTCKWGDPIYETTRLLQDVKTKQYDEKLYKLVVAMGSSRSSLLGEATIDLADYADASKPTAVALSLHGSDSGAILHVTLQLLTSKTGFREFEQQRELRERGLQTANDQTSPDESSGGINNQMEKVNARVRLKEKFKELPALVEEVGIIEDYADSAAGFDGSSNTSESLHAEKHDTSSTHEIDSLKSTTSGDLAGLSQSPQQEKGDPPDHRFLVQGTNDWVPGWGSDYSADNELAIVYEENSRLRGCLEVAELSIHELKLEVSSLQSHADEIGNEAQNFAQKLDGEIASGEQLAKEVSVLKSECSKLKDDLETLSKFKSYSPFNTREAIEKDQDHQFQNSQFRWLKGIVVLEDKIQEFHKKACLGFHERDFRTLQTDLEALLSLLQDLKQGAGGANSNYYLVAGEQENISEITERSLSKCEQFVSGTGFDPEFYQPEIDMLHCVSIPGLVSHDPNSANASNAMGGKIFELLRELDETKAERESLAKKMDQMECYYEALIQELEENQRQMLGELQNLRNEHSTCLYTISSSKAEMETMRQGLSEQIIRFSEEKGELDSLNKELERRALSAEAALKRARLNYSIAVSQLQKDLEHLSFQVLSMYESNENLIRQALVDSSQPSYHEYADIVQNQLLNSGESRASKLSECQSQYVGVKRQNMGGDILLEDLKRSLHLQEGLYRKLEEEACEMHFQNIYLDVFSKSLQETLLEASADIRLMKEKVDELTQQLELSNESNELLMQRLQTAMDDIHFLNESKATCFAKCSDMALQNQILEATLQNVTFEKDHLRQKITEWESVMVEFKSFQSKYEATAAEKIELVNLLEKESLENGNLRHDISSLQEELKTIKTEFGELTSVNENIQKTINFQQNKMQNLLSSYVDSFNDLSLYSESVGQELGSKDLTAAVLQLEELQRNAFEKIHQLKEEKKSLIDEKDSAEASLSKVESEIVQMRQKFEHDKREIVDKLDELGTIKTDFDELASVNENMQNTINFLQNKMQNLLSSYGNSSNELILCSESVGQDLESKDLTDIVLQLEKLQHNTFEKMCQLMEEKKSLIYEKDMAQASLSKTESDIVLMKQKFEHDKREIFDELDKFGSIKTEFDELASVNENLQNTINVLQNMMPNLLSSYADSSDELTFCNESLGRDFGPKDLKGAVLQLEKLQHNATEKIRQLTEEKKALIGEKDVVQVSLSKAESDILLMKQNFEHDISDMVDKLDVSNALVQKLQLKIEAIADKLKVSSEVEENHAQHHRDLFSDLDHLELELHQVSSKTWDLTQEILALETVTEEAERSKQAIAELTEENQSLMVFLQNKTEESAMLASEVNMYKESLQSQNDELHVERSSREKLESTVADLTSQLNEKHRQLIDYDQHKSDLAHLKQLVSGLELEKSRVCHLLLQYEKSHKIASEESSSVTSLESQLSEMHELLIAADVEVSFTRFQYEAWFEELVQQVHSSRRLLNELHTKNLDVETLLNSCLAREAQCNEENTRLLAGLDTVRSELHASVAEKRVLLDKNSILTAELEEYKNQAESMAVSYCKDNSQLAVEVERLKHLLVSSEEAIDDLMLSKEDLEVKALVLKAKLEEQCAQVTLLEGYNDEIMMLQNQCNELSRKLSEQILKTEEFKNLTIHLKELKDKSESECIQLREKRESEGPPTAVQESLRIAFIKEQYETKLQELKHQLSISKKHGEELLWKLQDAIDEIENRKKSEASHLKKNEELGVKLLELEAELQALIFDKREKANAYDLLKAELECSLMSLDCCKEEKQELESSLQECNEEKLKISADLTMMRELLDSSIMPIQNEGTGELCKQLIGRNVHQKNPTAGTSSRGRISDDVVSSNGPMGNVNSNYLEHDSTMTCEDAMNKCLVPIDEGSCSRSLMKIQPEQGVLVSGEVNGIPSVAIVNSESLHHGDTKHLSFVNDHFRAQSLKSSMEHLNEELERMKNENSLVSQDDHHFDPKFPGLQRELMQLHKVNEELGSICPVFNRCSSTGNAIERVLALEIELAESLQAKKKSSIQFQSSFLKQHSDEEAIFQSFRDINELIKDTLEIKGRFAAVETELKDMHDRYSQLSLQFAEVEGERQKLMMTLKNIRAYKNAQQLSRSSTLT
ncbi:hypothetical protein Dsin_002683 [Dipteronia sinensis]|uniref:C2 NT-type domain-containing protein n=1 Tax=Dipteronia sinensis TaxID=43782 RepID=A0AAE0B7K0_9ROSI|nr:hypothetical protein Dsin_002683 [Dipteronia sinensis]